MMFLLLSLESCPIAHQIDPANLFLEFKSLFIFFSNLYTQCRAQTHDPKIFLEFQVKFFTLGVQDNFNQV